ncbi:unnamed protein product [Brachionus calyciflorus]|uniref:Apple domain-containing protein n=1 Tax=Brachionus calyciflorus TaxID=104777 RepID=A0A813WS22_9BILA|nr:unnamed protein product [Brachionus calyciflorus]
MLIKPFQFIIISLVISLAASEYFTKNKNFDFNESKNSLFLISQSFAPNFLACVKACKLEFECAYFTYKFTECSLYTKYAIYIKKESQSSEIYTRLSTYDLNGLSYYWPVFDSLVNDLVSKADLYGPVNAIFIPNRLDCGIDRYKAVIVSLSDGYSNKPHYTIFYGDSQSSLRVISSNPLEIRVWYHLTFTFKNKIGYYYRNGVLDKFGELEYPKNITRTVCFLGRSQYPENDPDASADFDDIKIFNKALNEDEILKEYQKKY